VLDGKYPFVLGSDPAAEPVDASRLFADSIDLVVRLGEAEEVVSAGGHIDL
jgi:hypothetical protein